MGFMYVLFFSLTHSHSLAHSLNNTQIAGLVDYNCAWVKAWMNTNNYKLWRQSVDAQMLAQMPLPTYDLSLPSPKLSLTHTHTLATLECLPLIF